VARSAHRSRQEARRAGLLLSALLAACANLGDPPGGPPDTTPPVLAAVRPESGSVLPDFSGDAVFQFDEVIDEMAGAGGGGSGGGAAPIGGIAKEVILSPVAGRVDVSWHRSSIHVHPKEGWKKGRVYHLELLPGILDLRHNVRKEGQVVVFSTGPALPSASLSGTAVAWVEQRILTGGVIRAALLPDTVAYVAMVDSSGRFHLREVPPGRYLVTAIDDKNGNRALDRREAFDSQTVQVDSSATVVLWAFPHDTAGPRPRAADPLDSLGFKLSFTQALDPAHPLDSTAVQVFLLPDTTPVPVRAVLTQGGYDSLAARQRALADSIRKDSIARADTTKRDTLAARRDTTRPPPVRADTTARARQPQARDSALAKRAAFDSLTRRLLAARPAPQDHFVVRVGQALVPGDKYFIRVRGARNLNGAVADGSAVLAVPKPEPKKTPPAPKDSTARAPKDTTAKPVPRDTT